MKNWFLQLNRLVNVNGTDEHPLFVFKVNPPSISNWPNGITPNKSLVDFYKVCDGGLISLQYNFIELKDIELETKQWEQNLHNYYGDGQRVLIYGKHVVFAFDSQGAPIIWDSENDKVLSFYAAGGDWEPFNQSFDEFISSIFINSEEDDDDIWFIALDQLKLVEDKPTYQDTASKILDESTNLPDNIIYLKIAKELYKQYNDNIEALTEALNYIKKSEKIKVLSKKDVRLKLELELKSNA